MNGHDRIAGSDLKRIARREMQSHGLEADFPPEALAELAQIQIPAAAGAPDVKDMRGLLWCSIDNDDSRDLDQVSVAEALPDGQTKIYVGVADVDAVVKIGSALDRHARVNTTSVYTAAQVFPMLPEKLSTNLTSLSENEDRIAIVIEMTVGTDGGVKASDIYRALLRNRAKLAYDSVSAWLDGKGAMPAAVARVPGLDENLRLQDRVAHVMRGVRYEHGALEIETIEPKALMKDGDVVGLAPDPKNRGRELIEDFMIGSNGVTARFLENHRVSSIRRIVRTPKRWDKIVQLAQEFGEKLPEVADAKALTLFLSRRRQADPLRFPDLSLMIVKLMGPGEYVLEKAGQTAVGHFGLAVKDYSHSTAPNRRYPDLIAHRLVKAVLAGRPGPYSDDELAALAAHCTEQEDAAAKVERQVAKSAAAQFLSHRIGEIFDGIVTGASDKGTWVRVLNPPVEGRVVDGFKGMDVSDRVRVKLKSVNVDRGFIDFSRV